jgi:hypothetical protein
MNIAPDHADVDDTLARIAARLADQNRAIQDGIAAALDDALAAERAAMDAERQTIDRLRLDLEAGVRHLLEVLDR